MARQVQKARKAEGPGAYDRFLVTNARKSKRAGVTKTEWISAHRAACQEAAQAGGWRLSELAAHIADGLLAAEKVWPAEGVGAGGSGDHG